LTEESSGGEGRSKLPRRVEKSQIRGRFSLVPVYITRLHILGGAYNDTKYNVLIDTHASTVAFYVHYFIIINIP
jgi:hypothetical protein